MSASIESLERQLARPRNKQRRFELLAELAWKVSAISQIKAFDYAKQAIALAEQLPHEPPGLQRCLAVAANGYVADANLASAEMVLGRGFQLALKYDDEQCRAMLLYVEGEKFLHSGQALAALRSANASVDLAQRRGYSARNARLLRVRLCCYLGLPDEALTECLELADEAAQEKEARILSKVYRELGEVYNALNDRTNALHWLNEAAAQYRKLNHAYGEAGCCRSLGMIAYLDGDSGRALEYFHRAWDLFNSIPDSPGVMADVLTCTASVHSDVKDFEKAIVFIERAEHVAQQSESSFTKAQAYLVKAQLYFDQGQYRKAIPLFEQTLGYAAEIKLRNFERQIHKVLAEAYEHEGCHQQALMHEKMGSAVEKQLRGHQIQQRAARIAAQFELRRLRAAREEEDRRSRELLRRNDELHGNLNSLLISLQQRQQGLLKLKAEVEVMLDEEGKRQLPFAKRLMAEIGEQLQDADIRAEFQRQFEKAHGPFIRNLSRRAEALTPREIELCSLLRLNQSSQEIAELMYLSVNTVNTHRRHIRKKLGLARGDNLVTFLAGLQD